MICTGRFKRVQKVGRSLGAMLWRRVENQKSHPSVIEALSAQALFAASEHAVPKSV